MKIGLASFFRGLQFYFPSVYIRCVQNFPAKIDYINIYRHIFAGKFGGAKGKRE